MNRLTSILDSLRQPAFGPSEETLPDELVAPCKICRRFHAHTRRGGSWYTRCKDRGGISEITYADYQNES